MNETEHLGYGNRECTKRRIMEQLHRAFHAAKGARESADLWDPFLLYRQQLSLPGAGGVSLRIGKDDSYRRLSCATPPRKASAL
jgi:hypothetical protein